MFGVLKQSHHLSPLYLEHHQAMNHTYQHSSLSYPRYTGVGVPPRMEDFKAHDTLILAYYTNFSKLAIVLKTGIFPEPTTPGFTTKGEPLEDLTIYLHTELLPSSDFQHRHNLQNFDVVIGVEVSKSLLQPAWYCTTPTELQRFHRDTALFLSISRGACRHKGPIPVSRILQSWDCMGNETTFRKSHDRLAFAAQRGGVLRAFIMDSYTTQIFLLLSIYKQKRAQLRL